MVFGSTYRPEALEDVERDILLGNLVEDSGEGVGRGKGTRKRGVSVTNRSVSIASGRGARLWKPGGGFASHT